MELLIWIICISALIGLMIGVAAGYMLATLGTTNQKTGVFSGKMDRAVETEEFSRRIDHTPFSPSSSRHQGSQDLLAETRGLKVVMYSYISSIQPLCRLRQF